jgi:hypothetical protein
MNDEDTKNILAKLGLDDLPEEEIEEMLAEIGDVVMQGALTKAWNALDLAKQDELTTLLEASTAEPENDEKSNAVLAFLQTNVPDLDKYFKDEMDALLTAQRDALGELA